jgi:hypothetical protein
MEEIQGLVDISHIQNEAGWSPVIGFIVVPPAKMVNTRDKQCRFQRAAIGYPRYYRYNGGYTLRCLTCPPVGPSSTSTDAFGAKDRGRCSRSRENTDTRYR